MRAAFLWLAAISPWQPHTAPDPLPISGVNPPLNYPLICYHAYRFSSEAEQFEESPNNVVFPGSWRELRLHLLPALEHDSIEVWQYDSMTVWQYDSMTA